MSLSAPAAAPRPVVIAYWLYIVGAVLGLIALAIGAAQLPAAIAAAQAQAAGGTTTVSASTVQTVAVLAFVVAALLGVVFAVLFIVFARLMLRGRNWARIVLAVLAFLQILGIANAYGVGALHAIAVVVAALLTLLPADSRLYFQVNRAGAPLV